MHLNATNPAGLRKPPASDLRRRSVAGAFDRSTIGRHLFTIPGRSIDPSVIASFIAELYRRYNIRGLAYDRWRVDELLREFDRLGLTAHKDGEKGGS